MRVLCNVMGFEEYMQDASLMRKAIGMMDNVVSADEEFADIVFDKGGRKLVQAVQALHRKLSGGAANADDDDEDDSKEVVDACVSCLLSMDAMAKQKEQAQASKTGRAALFARLGGDAVDLGGGRNLKEASANADPNADPEPEEDPLKEHRAMLAKGAHLKGWTKGVPMEQHFYVPQEFNSLMLRDASAAKTKPGLRIPLRSIDKVVPGKGEGHVKKGVVFGGNTKDKAEQCLVLLDKPKAGAGPSKGKELACLSFETTEECELWTAALDRLLQTSRNWPHRLKGATADA